MNAVTVEKARMYIRAFVIMKEGLIEEERYEIRPFQQLTSVRPEPEYHIPSLALFMSGKRGV
jgi:hypothetical protein